MSSPADDGPRLGRVAARLRDAVAAEGPLPFDRFMEIALYAPGDGYYTCGRPRTGRTGDYFTNVSVGSVFGRLLAVHIAEVWDGLGRPRPFVIAEQGASDGQLLEDVLAALRAFRPGCHAAAEALLVEPAPALRERQHRTVRSLPAPLRHAESEDALPPFTGVLYANELLDAFPVRLFRRRAGAWHERLVDSADGRFVFTEKPVVSAPLAQRLYALPVDPDVPVFDTELNLRAEDWVRSVARKLEAGSVLVCDYGHPASARHDRRRAGGTLTAYRGHQREADPLETPGGRDLTSHVDFTATAGAGLDAGLRLAGFGDQHHVLTGLAAAAFPPMPRGPLAPDHAREMRALRMLLHPETMGRSFHFLGFHKGLDGCRLSAFAHTRPARNELGLAPDTAP